MNEDTNKYPVLVKDNIVTKVRVRIILSGGVIYQMKFFSYYYYP